MKVHQTETSTSLIVYIFRTVMDKWLQDHLHTVSLARRSGSSRPRCGLETGISQHRIMERSKCWSPSIHCTMIFPTHQKSPYLLKFRKEESIPISWIKSQHQIFQTISALAKYCSTCWPFPDTADLFSCFFEIATYSSPTVPKFSMNSQQLYHKNNVKKPTDVLLDS